MTTRDESPTFPTLFHVVGILYAKSLATRLPVSRVDTYYRRLDSKPSYACHVVQSYQERLKVHPLNRYLVCLVTYNNIRHEGGHEYEVLDMSARYEKSAQRAITVPTL